MLRSTAFATIALLSASPLTSQEELIWLDVPPVPQTWFAGSFLPRYVRVQLRGVGSETCENHSVSFEPFSEGEASPIRVPARWRIADGEGWCEAETRWKLGSAIGVQKLRASIDSIVTPFIGDTLRRPHRILEAVARAGPRVTVGLAMVNIAQRYDTLAVVGTDSTLAPAREGSEIIPVFGVETPIVVPPASSSAFLRGFFGRLRLFVAASIDDPGEDLFFGLAVLPFTFGQQWEELAFQLGYGFHLARRRVAESGPACVNGGNSSALCERDRFFLNHPTLTVTLDASDLIAVVLRAIGIP